MKTAFLLLACGTAASAQTGGPWAIRSSTLDGGGTRSTGGAWKMTGTLGQPDASAPKAGGGGWAVAGGFWPTAVALPGEPMLAIHPLNATEVTVAWTAAAVGYQLQYATTLQGWTDYPGLTISGAAAITWPLRTGPRCFFRLKKL
jgi:hypothetical protein